jgi:hypothetical protein
MNTYKEQQENKHNFVLMKGSEVIGTFGNLRKICNFVTDESFPSYWTLVRKNEEDYPISAENYTIFKVKHY